MHSFENLKAQTKEAVDSMQTRTFGPFALRAETIMATLLKTITLSNADCWDSW